MIEISILTSSMCLFWMRNHHGPVSPFLKQCTENRKLASSEQTCMLRLSITEVGIDSEVQKLNETSILVLIRQFIGNIYRYQLIQNWKHILGQNMQSLPENVDSPKESDYPLILCFESIQKYYKEWSCPIQTLQINGIYYKYLEGDAQITFMNGNQYVGTIAKGFYEGYGEFYWSASQITYKGNFSRNQITGLGEFRYPDGSYYKGFLKNGQRQGYGQFYQAPSEDSPLHDLSYKYIGSWLKNKRQGKGTITYENGSSFDGEWSNDLRNGYGKMIYQSGSQYQGEWKLDKKSGIGTMNWVSHHERYKGNWENDVPHGYGEYYWFDNRTEYKIIKNLYKGYWKEGKREGFGTFHYSNGCRFQGEFSDNMKNGYGLSVDEYGYMKISQYKNDRMLYVAPTIEKKKERRGSKSRRGSISLNKTQIHKLPKINSNKLNISSKNNLENEAPLQSSNKISYLNAPVQNEYKKYIDFEHPCITDNFYNFLLRHNSRLHTLYKNIASSSVQCKEYYSGMTLQNYWKAVRESKIMSIGLNNHEAVISMADINRAFVTGKRSWYTIANEPQSTVLDILKERTGIIQKSQYKNIPWLDFFYKLQQFPFSFQSSISQSGLCQYSPPSEAIRDIHNPQQIILFRHFICLIVHTGLLLSPIHCSQKKLKSTIQQMLNNLESTYDPSSNNLTNNPKHQKLSVGDSHLTTQKQIYLPEWTEKIHKKFLEKLFGLPKKKLSFGILDQTTTLRFLINLLEKGNLFKDLNEKLVFIEKIQRWLNVRGVLFKKDTKNLFLNACLQDESKGLSQYTGNEPQIYDRLQNVIKISPYFQSIMSYELNYKEIKQILFQTVTRKIVGGSSPEQFHNKYEAVVQAVSEHIKIHQHTQDYLPLKEKRRKSDKDIQKEKMIEQFLRKKKEQEERLFKKEELAREEKERVQMMREDRDASSVDDGNQYEMKEDDYYM